MNQLKFYYFISIIAFILFGNISIASAAYTGYCTTSQDITDLPPGHWCEVPNSNARSVEKKPQEYNDWNGSSSAAYDSFQRSMGFEAIMHNWNGGAFDSFRDRLLIFGGGHNGYGGNEILAFDLKTLRWTRLTDPTPYSNRHPNYQNDDNTPISRHSYGSLEYIEHTDRFFVFGGSPDSQTGDCGIRGTWTFNLSAREFSGNYSPEQWELKTTNTPSSNCDDNAVYDPVSGRIYYHYGPSPSGWSSYDFNSNTWKNHNYSGAYEGVRTVIPGERRFIVEFGNGRYQGYAKFDLNSSELTRTIITTTGDKSMEQANDPGAAYDWSSDRIVAWDGGDTVYSLDVATNKWYQHPAANTNLANPGSVQAVGGTFGRFRYSKNLNVFVVVDHVDENVFLYRFAKGSGIFTPSDSDPNAPELQVK